SEIRVKVSPMMPVGAAPGLVIKPVAGSKNVAAPPQGPPGPPVLCAVFGSQFGIRNGFTPLAMTGTAVPPPTLAEFEGLNPSAVAEARTASGVRLQMREKNVGRFVFCTVTVTCGFTLKVGVPL